MGNNMSSNLKDNVKNRSLAPFRGAKVFARFAFGLSFGFLAYLGGGFVTGGAIFGQSGGVDSKEQTSVVEFHTKNGGQAPSRVPADSFAQWGVNEMVFTQDDLARLPNGGHNFALGEAWYPSAILSNPDTGGFSAVEAHEMSIHAESTRWQRYYWNAHDFSDPANPGAPLIELPSRFWSQMELPPLLSPYLHGQGTTFRFDTASDTEGATFLSLTNPGHMGGESWIPVGFSDREPAMRWGAAEERREFGPAFEGQASILFSGIGGHSALARYEFLSHQRTFMKLDGYEEATRQSAMVSQNFSDGQLDLFFQSGRRDKAGIETGQDPSLAFNYQYDALFAAYSIKKDKFEINANSGYRKEVKESADVMVWDLTDEVIFRNPHRPYESKAFFLGTHSSFSLPLEAGRGEWSGEVATRFERVTRQSLYSGDLFGRTYQGAPADITVYDQSGQYGHNIFRLAPMGNYTSEIGGITLNASAGLNYELAKPDGDSPNAKDNKIQLASPLAAAKMETRRGKWTLYGGFLSDPIPLTDDLAAFANPGAPSGARYSWNDDGDLVPEAGEIGGVINRTGGEFHTIDENLKAARRNEIYFGYQRAKKRPLWSGALSARFKHFQNLYTVAYDPAMLDSLATQGYADGGYIQVDRPDIREGHLYARVPAAAGTELYMLTNRSTPALYAGLELQTLKVESSNSPWFLNFVLGAYYGQAENIVGNGPDYNDMGRISETSADPNKQINELARIDFDRAYVGHLIIGWRPFEGFVWSNLIRYRDGEPFGQMLVAEGLPQGPVIIQNQARSEPPDGMPRYTYYFCWDVRLSYERAVAGGSIAGFFDVYNIIDSRSELYEYTIAGEQFRDSVEARGGRTYRAQISYYWE